MRHPPFPGYLAALLVGALVGLTRFAGAAEPPAEHAASPDPAERAQPAPPPVIQRLRERGVRATFGGVVGRSLTLWMLERPEQPPSLVMTTPEGYLVQGKVYNPRGDLVIDMTARRPFVMEPARRRREGFAPLPDAPPDPPQNAPAPEKAPAQGASPADAEPTSAVPTVEQGIWSQLRHATVLEEGQPGAPLVYIFFDPYCDYCHQQWTALRGKVAGGALRVRWVPVAVLLRSQSQMEVVQGLLRDPRAETLAAWMRQQRVEPDGGEATKAALGRNMALFQALQAPSVPALLYKDGAGQLVTRVGVTPL